MRKASEKDEELDSNPVGQAHETVTPEQSRLQDLGRLAGNAAVAGAMMSAPESTVRSQVEGVTGFDLSPTTIHRDSTRAASAGVHGLTEGHEVHLAPGISPGTPHGDHVLAHELGHVVQQSTATPGNHDSLEADAESTAHSRTGSSSSSLATLPAPKHLAVQHFDPRFHRTSVVDGLAGSDFTPEETGLIYAANWERDLSQAHPALGNVILEWKAAKVAAAEGRLTDAEINGFQDACRKIADTALSSKVGDLASGEAYGGYKFYEHMDNPGLTAAAANVRALGPIKTDGLPPHIFVSREYIKEMLFNAAKLNHPELATGATATAATHSQEMRAVLDKGAGSGLHGGMPSGAVAEETAAEVRRSAGSGSGSGPAVDPESLDLIGRASHALEDFWSHSNFVELAIGDVKFQLQGLTTATFGTADKAHALSHKLRGLADEIAAEIPLADRLAHRRRSNPRTDQVHLGDETPPVHDSFLGDFARSALEHPIELLTLSSSSGAGAAQGWRNSEGQGVGSRLLETVKGGVSGGTASLVTSWGGVSFLRSASEALDVVAGTWQEAAGDNQAHGLLAKDQPGHDDDSAGELKTVKFELAHALSVASDRMVTARMKAVINAPGGTADQLLSQIYADLDKLIAGPSKDHPLADVIEQYRERAAAALEKYNAIQAANATLTPPVM